MGAPHTILVIANETAEGDALHDLIRRRAAIAATEVVIVAPALNSRLRHWASDEDGARHRAGERLERSLVRLEASGVGARGWIGDADPMLAIEDALGVLEADELIVATHPEPRSNWLAHRLVERARETLALPVTDVVVDPDAQREYLVAA